MNDFSEKHLLTTTGTIPDIISSNNLTFLQLANTSFIKTSAFLAILLLTQSTAYTIFSQKAWNMLFISFG